jgi:hypothetical protein
MTRQAAAGDIEDVLLCVLALHPCLVMAAIAIDSRAAIGMTLAALPSRTTVVHRERMVRN